MRLRQIYKTAVLSGMAAVVLASGALVQAGSLSQQHMTSDTELAAFLTKRGADIERVYKGASPASAENIKKQMTFTPGMELKSLHPPYFLNGQPTDNTPSDADVAKFLIERGTQLQRSDTAGKLKMPAALQ